MITVNTYNPAIRICIGILLDMSCDVIQKPESCIVQDSGFLHCNQKV